MVKLRRANKSLKEIANLYGVHWGTVRYRLCQVMPKSEYERLSVRCRQLGKVPATKADRNAQMVSMRQSGATISSIATEFGVKCATVVGVLSRDMPIEQYEDASQRKRWQLSDPAAVRGIELTRSGVSIRQAAAEVGMPISCLSRLVKKLRNKQ